MSQQTEHDEQLDNEPRKEEEAFLYKDSGIHENRGYIPFWLILVAIALLIWGIYYTIQYWEPPPV